MRRILHRSPPALLKYGGILISVKEVYYICNYDRYENNSTLATTSYNNAIINVYFNLLLPSKLEISLMWTKYNPDNKFKKT